MIAVFTYNDHEFRDLQVTPRKNFKRIKSFNDLRGQKFSGIIRTRDWWRSSKDVEEIYEQLKMRQPELLD